jgi:hypothetical protein
MRDFMTACDYCLSDCSDDGHSLDNEATTLVCRRMTIPLGLRLALTSCES